MQLFGKVGHNPGINSLDFGTNLDLDPDPRISEGILRGKGFSLWVWQQLENTHASGPQNEQIKGYLGGGLRPPSASLLVMRTPTTCRGSACVVLRVKEKIESVHGGDINHADSKGKLAATVLRRNRNPDRDR